MKFKGEGRLEVWKEESTTKGNGMMKMVAWVESMIGWC
jgi:hypothetical protein